MVTPEASILSEFPFESSISTDAGPFFSVTLGPFGFSSVSVSWPSVSSSVIETCDIYMNAIKDCIVHLRW